ncbi:hypothetical protein PR048_033139 [Dryococelus australis]|uniref:Uncharacterized protein n=1 Tax=Dryococelus australis TaxID=614101 RepID=A0ABQ9G3M9_9NEOP|nr:hypothetical protein PR048_033139 [Dryococelus australis]
MTLVSKNRYWEFSKDRYWEFSKNRYWEFSKNRYWEFSKNSGDESDNIAADCEMNDTTSEQEIDREEEDVIRSQSESESTTSEEDSGYPGKEKDERGSKILLREKRSQMVFPVILCKCPHHKTQYNYTSTRHNWPCETARNSLLSSFSMGALKSGRLSDENRYDYRDIDIVEFKAFLGILMFSRQSSSPIGKISKRCLPLTELGGIFSDVQCH